MINLTRHSQNPSLERPTLLPASPLFLSQQSSLIRHSQNPSLERPTLFPASPLFLVQSSVKTTPQGILERWSMTQTHFPSNVSLLGLNGDRNMHVVRGQGSVDQEAAEGGTYLSGVKTSQHLPRLWCTEA